MALSLGACATYATAPPHPETYAARLQSQRLDERPAGAVWTGADLLRAALTRNPDIAAARGRYLTAVAAARTAKLSPPLTLTLTAEYASNETPRWGYGGAADIPLDIGARRGARVTSADLQALQALYAYGDAVWTVRTALEKARADLASLDEELPLAEQAVALRRDREAGLERRVAAGQDPRAIALTARTDRLAAERRLADAQARRDQAQGALAKALGVGQAAVQGLALAPPPPAPPLNDLATWRADAAQSRSDVLKAIADYDLSETALRLEVAKQYPEVRLAPGYSYDHGIRKFPFSLSLALPTYDLNRRAIDQAETARAASGRSLEAVQASALAAVDAAVASLAGAQADIDRTRSQDLPLARRLATNAALSVRLGETDRTDDLAARAAVVDAQLTLLTAQRAAGAATADLEDALRRSFDPAEAFVLARAMTTPGEAR
jgi:cobalt-zinc-cadmium efflux system outer membrane protein